MATDSPHLAVDQIPLAFTLMETHGVVLGRVLDGGYYLACVRGNGDVIRQSKTGSDDAAQSLAQVAVKMGLSVGELKRTFDVDTWDDLVLLADHLAQFPGDAPNTLAALKKHSLDDPSSSFRNGREAGEIVPERSTVSSTRRSPGARAATSGRAE